MADSPFYQNARQNFSSSQSMQQPQGGFGGFGGGYQMPQQNWGGGFGGGGFGFGGGFQPQGFGYGGGFSGFGGGFQPQQQFNSYQGGFGGGYNPMFGGIGGLGFNPMMGQGFGMPMQGFGGFNPDQPEMLSARDPYRANESGMPMPGPTGRESFDNPRSMDTMYRGGPEMRQRQALSGLTPLQPQQQPQQNPFEDQQRQLRSQVDALPEYQALQNAQRALEGSDAFKSIQQKQQELGAKMHAFDVQQNREQGQRMRQAQMPRDIQTGQPMFGGIGGLGFNPMMGPQFGMPMQQPIQPSSANETYDQYMRRMNINRMNGFVEPQSTDRYSPMMGPQFGMPMQRPMSLSTLDFGQQPSTQAEWAYANRSAMGNANPTEDWQQQQIRQFGRLSHNPYTGAQY